MFFQSIALFESSVQYRKLIYKTSIDDGDNKAYSAVRNSMPYGTLVYITREESSAHIIKRMGTGLWTVITNNEGNIPQLLSYSFQNNSVTFLYISSISSKRAPSLALKTLENQKFSDCFRSYRGYRREVPA